MVVPVGTESKQITFEVNKLNWTDEQNWTVERMPDE